MSKKSLKLFIFILIVNYAHFESISVTTNLGIIIGESVVTDGKELYQFLGIPYAEPPIKNLRFKKPVPVNPWKNPLNAVNLPNRCYQNATIPDFPKRSEDCLYLNILSLKQNFNSLKPVVIYIHGGGFAVGYSLELQLPMYRLISLKNNAIIVTINYRVGTFGFLYAQNKKNDAPGNVGLYDQLLAIQWVRNNIMSFGGDPKQITLTGGSAGAISVQLHILSPLTRNMFNNAVAMTSPMLNPILNHIFGENPSVASNAWVKGAKIVGCGNGIVFTDATMECLRKLDPEILWKIPFLDGFSDRKAFNLHFGLPPLIIYGNEFLPKRPIDMLKSGNYKKNFSFLQGTNNGEGSAALSLYPEFFNTDNVITFKDAYKQMIKILNDFQLKRPIDPNDVAIVYFTGIPHNDSARLRYALSNIIADYFVVCPMILFSNYIYAGDKQNSRVYQYHFTQRLSPNLRIQNNLPQWVRNEHAIEVYYFIGHPIAFPSLYTGDDLILSSSMSNDLMNFIFFGNLPPRNGIQWSNYSIVNGDVIRPYYEYNSIINDNGNFGLNLKHPECDILWKRYIESE